MSISIANIDKAKILVALYKFAKVRNSFQHYTNITYGIASELLERQTRFNIFEGKALYIDLKGDTLNVSIYDQHNGKNAAQFALQELIQNAARKQSAPVPRNVAMQRTQPISRNVAVQRTITRPVTPIVRKGITPINKSKSVNPIKKFTPPEPEIDDYQMVNSKRINQLEAIIKYEQDKLSRQQKRIDIFEKFAGLARDLDRLEYEEQAANLKNPIMQPVLIENSIPSITQNSTIQNSTIQNSAKEIEYTIEPTYIPPVEIIYASEMPNINNLRTLSQSGNFNGVSPSDNLNGVSRMEDSDSDSISEINVSILKNNNNDKPVSVNEIDSLFDALNHVQHKKIEEVATHLLNKNVNETTQIKSKLELQRERYLKEQGITPRKY